MFKALFGSLTGKLASVALLLAGLTGGMAATGDVSTLASFVSRPADVTVSPSPPPAVTLDFPVSVLAKPAPEPPAGPPAPAPPPVEVVVETVAVPAPASRPAAVPQCVGQLESLVQALAGTVQAITSPEQAQAVLAHAGNLGEASRSCAAEVSATGNEGLLQQLSQVTGVLTGLVGQIQSLPILVMPAEGSSPDPVGAVIGVVSTGLEMTLGAVNKGLGLLLGPPK